MNRNIEQGLTEMRNTAPSPGQVEEAAARVLENLGMEYNKVVPLPERIQSCADFRALIPAYLSSSLTTSRRLLLEDHLHECVACRKAAKNPPLLPEVGSLRETRPRTPLLRFAAAAVAAILVMVAALQTTTVRDFIWPIDVHATALAIDGSLYSFSGQAVRSLTAGQRIERYESVRTGNNSGAVLELADGSRIEMSARSEVSLDRARDGVAIRLARGNIIVTAAKQRNGHLYAETKDCMISVVGTVFSVNSGAKGSRVTVIEGEVHVRQGDATEALRPGMQLSTNAAMAPVPARQEIAWSRDAAILNEMLQFAENVGKRIEKMEMRHASDLVPLVPSSTLVFASLPNISQSIAASYALFKQRISENQMLKDWWMGATRKGDNGLSFDDVVQRITTLGLYLGPEVILAFPGDHEGEAPVLLADVTRPDDLAAALKEFQGAVDPGGRHLAIYVDKTLLIVSSDPGQIQRSLAYRQQPGLNAFANTSLYQRLEKAYVEGAGWILAADFKRLVTPGEAHVQQLGLGNMEQLFVEQKTGADGAVFRATLGFNQERRGMASWLAEPAPMGALDFVSPKAYGVAAVVTKDPSLMVEDIFGLIQSDARAQQDLENYERDHRIDIRRDIAAPLGNEFLIAVDGPILPNPSWKVVIEVNDAARLQNAIQWSIQEVNREAAARGEPAMTLASETAGGRTYYAVTSAKLPTAIHYTFWAGYMIISPSRALLIETIQNHDAGMTLARSAVFRSQFPADGHDYASGFIYQNVQAIANTLPAGALQQAVDALPTLVCMYGETDRIVMSSKGVLGMNIASIAGIHGMAQAIGLH